METVRRLMAVTWAAGCVGVFLVVMLLLTVDSTRDEGTARDAVFRALGDEVWVWLLAFGPLAVLGIGIGRLAIARVARSHTAVDVVGPPVGLALVAGLVVVAIGVLGRF